MKRVGATLWLTFAYGLFIVYGSLVPLAYVPLPLDEAWARFQQIPYLNLGLDSRADWVANGVLYLPLTFGLTRAGMLLRWPAAVATLASIVLGWALAVGVEFTQLWFPNRTVSLNDILAECIGSVLGPALAVLLSRWTDRIALALRHGGTRMLPHLLQAYAAGYLVLCFFPYDLLLSASEVQGKWQSGLWGWWLATTEDGHFITALRWLVELTLAMPLGGLAFVRGRESLGAPRTGMVALARAAGFGLLLGVVIEVGQFFVASGVSQGASVLSRGVGVAAGAALLPWLKRLGGQGVRSLLLPWSPALWLVYLPLLAAASGLFRHAWHGLAGARASWQETHLLPFYYHYFTSEALALYSLGSVALMYAPVVGLGTMRGWRPAGTLGTTALLAVLAETAKLFVNELHADPTNVLVAVAGNALGLGLIGLARREVATALPTAMPPWPEEASAQPQAFWWLVPIAAVAWAAGFPAMAAPLVALLLVAAAVVARWPVLALGLVPAMLPLLDLAPWSGRFFLDEFDLLQAVVLAVACSRVAPVAAVQRPAWWRAILALLGLSLLLSTLRGLWPGAALDANAWASYLSPYSALRVVKGALWAWAFLSVWRRLEATGPWRSQVFGVGMLVGLAGTLAVIAWERQTFASLWDFAADFRVTGPFSVMNRGGAYVECYLAVAAAFTLALAWRAQWWLPRLLALAGVVGIGYAMMVTYSRNGYAALAVVLLASMAVAVREAWRGRAAWRQAGVGALAAILLLAAAVPVLMGSYAQERLAQSAHDLDLRRAHWLDGLALRDDGLMARVIGMGLGRFPALHAARSAEPVHAAGYRLVPHGQGHALRLVAGARLYVEQIVPRPEFAGLHLSFDQRAEVGTPKLGWALCEKWTLTSRACAKLISSQATDLPGAPGWQRVEAKLDASELLARPAPWRAPWKLSLFTPEEGVLDVANVQLKTAFGDPLLVNGDFHQGLDRWFFATDIDPPWHLHSLPVAVLFEQGWLGVVSLLALGGAVLGVGGLLLWRGQAQVPAALPALLGFATSGLLNTLIDVPRFLWLLLVLSGLALARWPQPDGAPPARPPGAR